MPTAFRSQLSAKTKPRGQSPENRGQAPETQNPKLLPPPVYRQAGNKGDGSIFLEKKVEK
jgi:hypothetical protein